MRFPEFQPPSREELRDKELKSIQSELVRPGTTAAKRNELLTRIIELEGEHAESIHGALSSPEDMHFSKDDQEEFEKIHTIHEKDAYDLMEERDQLKDAIKTYTQALKEIHQDNPSDFELYKKINGMLKGSKGVLELIENELTERIHNKQGA
jgi:hypothetical protein